MSIVEGVAFLDDDQRIVVGGIDFDL